MKQQQLFNYAFKCLSFSLQIGNYAKQFYGSMGNNFDFINVSFLLQKDISFRILNDKAKYFMLKRDKSKSWNTVEQKLKFLSGNCFHKKTQIETWAKYFFSLAEFEKALIIFAHTLSGYI